MQPFTLWVSAFSPGESDLTKVKQEGGRGGAMPQERAVHQSQSKSLGKQLRALELQNVAFGKNQLNPVTDGGDNQRRLRIQTSPPKKILIKSYKGHQMQSPHQPDLPYLLSFSFVFILLQPTSFAVGALKLAHSGPMQVLILYPEIHFPPFLADYNCSFILSVTLPKKPFLTDLLRWISVENPVF